MKNEEKIEFLLKEFTLLKSENQMFKEEIKELKQYKEKYKILESNIISLTNTIKTLEKKITNLEKFHSQLRLKSTINAHENDINSLLIFPSGNIISVSDDKSIQIRDKNYNIIYNKKDAHYEGISGVSIKDECNFATCSWDKSIKLWEKINNNWSLKETIVNAHNNEIYKIIYCNNNNLISCSKDNTVKIWIKKDESNHQCEISLKNSEFIYSILLLDNKKTLICAGRQGTFFWDIIKYQLIHHIKDANCASWNSLYKYDDKIIVGGSNIISVISIINFHVEFVININSICWGVCFLRDKNLICICNYNGDIQLYDNINFKCVQTIEKAHDDSINGLTLLYDGSIASFSMDKKIKIWDF